jgi:glucokinase
MSSELVLAVDIGGSKASFACVRSDGTLYVPVDTVRVPFSAPKVADVGQVIRLFQKYMRAVGDGPDPIAAIGLSLCGNVDMDSGEAVLTPNLGWRNVPIGRLLNEAFGLPVFAATDVYMAGLAEMVWGKAQSVRHFAWGTIGTGYGGFLFLDGKPYGGSHGFAGNFGHNTWDEINGELCGCGKRGCVETYVAGPAIARAGQRAMDSGESLYLPELVEAGIVSAKMVFAAARRGDPACRSIVEEAMRKIAVNLSGLVNTLDLEMIILGGGVVQGNPEIVAHLSQAVRPHLMTFEAKRDLQIEIETFENSALIGAAAHAYRCLNS